jgi:transmembrane sensor
MSANDNRVRSLITQQAADWFIGNRAGLTANERHTFATWLKASPMHVEEYLALSALSSDLREACGDPQCSVDELLTRARLEGDTSIHPLWSRVIAGGRGAAPGRWRTAAVTLVALGVLSVGLLAPWNFRPVAHVSAPVDATVLHLETRHGEQLTRRLADSSVLHLNTESAVTIRYSGKERRVVLTSGEADFEVAPEAERAFWVFAGSAQIVAIGTKFDVRLREGLTVVTVVHGRVAVGPSPTSEAGSTNSSPQHLLGLVQVDADEQISVTNAAWPAKPVAVDAQRTTAWLHRQIMFDHEPLERVAVEFNRYAPKPIEIISPALRNLEISGVFATDDIDAFIAFLRSLEGVRVEVTGTRIRVSQD